MKALPWEKISCALALLLTTGTALWSGMNGAKPAMRLESVTGGSVEFQPNDRAKPAAVAKAWPSPVPLSRVGGWTYEVFGPPEVHYNGSTCQITVASPRDVESAGGVFGQNLNAELTEVHRVPFRLQLVGYMGAGDASVGTFLNVETGETFLARAGCSLPKLGLVITKFAVARQAVVIPESMTSIELVATAEARDLKSGEVTVLTDRAPVYLNQSTADGDPVTKP